MFRDCTKILCLLSGILGFVLVGLAIFLLATGYPLIFVTIGAFIAGLILLLFCCFTRCCRVSCILCLLFVLIGLFLIVAGIISILTISATLGIILIVLGILALLLEVLCLICRITFMSDRTDDARCGYHKG